MSLEHITVLDVGAFITGPLACSMLGDLGATVIKVERPKSGDPYRAFSGGLYGPPYCAVNWNKRSIVIDLRKPEGVALFLELAERADVVVENFRPGTTDGLGIGYDALRARNPRLVYCSITGFGTSGPYRDRPSYDMVAQGMSGYLSILMDFSDPWIPNPAVGDQISGMYGAQGVLGALLEREKTGVGRLVEVNMLNSVIKFVGPHSKTRDRESRATTSQSYIFGCSDDKVLVIHLSTPEHFWINLLKAIAAPALASDPRFSERRLRIRNYQLLKGELGKIFRTKPRDEWLDVLIKNDVPCAPAYSVEEVREDPQVQHMGTYASYSHPTEGEVQRVRSPILFDGKRDERLVVPPALGEHTDAILRELQKSEAEIARLRGIGVI
jgi:crotonobetainyl-CoA:carnitine CoA-transferase CaiB-like acyl-CoA transferase